MSNVLCFKYGLLAPIENKDLVSEQIFEGHRVYNNYIAAAIDVRNKKRAILNSVQDPELELERTSALLELTEAQNAVKNARIELSSKTVSKELTQKVSVAKKRLKDINKRCTDFKKSHKDDIKPLLAMVKDDENSKKRDVYNNNDLFWGSELLIRKSVDQAEKTTPIFSNPKFRIWKGVGQIGIQRQGQQAIPVEDLFTPNDQVWIERVSKESKSRRSNHRVILHLRIQSGEKRRPIFASFPMIMHRQFPDGAKVSWVSVKRNKIGSRDEWSASFTLDVSGCEKCSSNYKNNAVAIDIGWRQCSVEDDKYSIRVCAWVGDDGQSGEFILDSKIIDRLKLERSLSSIRKTNFTEALQKLIGWCKDHDMPDWLLEVTRRKKHEELPTKAQAIAWLSEWKSEARLASLAIKWSKNRFIGDEEVFGYRPKKENGKPIKETAFGLEGWRYNDYHIWNMLESIRTSVRRSRRERYRIFAYDLASKYSTLVIEDFDISKIAEKAPLGSSKEIDRNDKAQSNRQLTAPSELIGCLKFAFEKVGGRVAAVNPANTSKKCAAVISGKICGSIEEIGSNQTHTCTKCGSVWDRDFNSCHNQLQLWCERSGDVKVLVPARNEENFNENNKVKGEKWKKVREHRAEKKLKIEGPRKLAPKQTELLAS